MMRLLHVPRYLQQIIVSVYDDAAIFVETKNGSTRNIKMSKGVKQGCPISPLIFNMCFEALLRLIKKHVKGYAMHKDSSIASPCQAYADDLVTTNCSPFELAETLLLVEKFANWAEVQFGIKKCAILAITFTSSGQMVYPDLNYTLDGDKIPVKSVAEFYKYLGTETGLLDNQPQLDSRAEAFQSKLGRLMASPLEPWQKLVAMKTFLYPQLEFLLSNSLPSDLWCEKLDRHVRAACRRLLALPAGCSSHFFHSPMGKGGLGL
eukprot:TRINITY_DN162_c0_g1_i10.p2 TRINITY_DN162_c0_g1~~TRINITY_DN162_c0_g1_i10.p2  ORF type:complete len:263 (+),score=35.42 TRINITY_DN162_c0_g1_i10:922-1710(+)